MAAQVNNLNNIQIIDPISIGDILVETLNTTAVDLSPYQNLYVGSDTYDIFWELTYKDRSVKLYGTKCIKTIGNSFIYEAVVFDEFPKDKEAYSICIGNTEEESYLEFVSDTCIRFVLSRR